MNYNFRIIVLSLTISLSTLGLAQQTVLDSKPLKIDSLVYYQNKIYKATSDQEKFKWNNAFKRILEDTLQNPITFNMNFDSLKQIGRLLSPDKAFRLYTWNIALTDGSHRYFGFIQTAGNKKYPAMVFELTDKSESMKNPENLQYSHTKWYGMLYYKIIPSKMRKKTTYLLLGWDGNDKLTQKKFIDVLNFTTKGEPVFGDNVFKVAKKNPRRIIFEYASDLSMSLKYIESNQSIQFDHLAPSDPSKVGQFQYYGPDFSIDAFKYSKGKWVLIEDVDAKNNKSAKDNIYRDPKQTRPSKDLGNPIPQK